MLKAFVVFRKTVREMTRDLWVLGLTLLFAPLFVLLYWFWFYGGSTTYTVLVLNHDRGVLLADGTRLNAGEELIGALQSVTYADGQPLLGPKQSANRDEMMTTLQDREATAFLEIPEDFSRTILALKEGDRSATAGIIFGGDLTNPYYAVGSALSLGAVESYVVEVTGQQPLIHYVEEPLGASAARSEFEIYVPGVIILAVILLIFQAAMTVAREIESGALQRYQLAPISAFSLLGGITAGLMLVGVAAVVLTFATAVALGFRSQGPLWVAILIGAVTSLAVIGVGLVVACFCRTVSQAFVVANFPLALMMFFTGAIFPLPAVTLFTVGEQAVGLYDLLPPTHAVVALNKILTLGVGFKDVANELAALVALSIIFFAVGVGLFQRMHLKR